MSDTTLNLAHFLANPPVPTDNHAAATYLNGGIYIPCDGTPGAFRQYNVNAGACTKPASDPFVLK